jgi:hypothetical protein
MLLHIGGTLPTRNDGDLFPSLGQMPANNRS